MNINKNKRAFTIIELIVVIAIIGILVLFGMPKLIGYVGKAQLARIQHDTKVMETMMEDEIVNHGYINYDDFAKNEKKLGALILANKLFEKQGYAKFIEDPVEVKYLASKTKEFQETATVRLYANNELGVGGPVIEGTEDGFGSVSQKYKVIPKEWEVKSGTRLKGTFYVNEAGKVYYEPDKPLGPNAKPAKPDACVAPGPLPDYTFEHEVGKIAKYHGNAEHLVIPAYFKVDEQCWPVRIIGKGAFMQGGFKSIKLPPTLKEIEPGALEDIGLEDEIIIPGSVDKVGPGAFDNNDLEDIIYEGSPEQVKPGAIPPSFPQKDGKDIPVTYKPPTPGQAGVIVKPNNSGGVTITGGGSSASPGGSSASPGGSGSSNPHIPPYVNVGGKDKPVTEIGEGAYQGKGLITVDLPFTLEIIEDYAFAGNQLIGITIPNGVKEIGHYAFGFNEREKVGNIKGPDTMGTIKSIILKEKEQFNKVDKYGNILEGGSKVNIFKSSGGVMGPDIRLKDHIWVTSAGNIVIDEEYIGNNKDNTGLLKDIINKAEGLKKESYESISWDKLEKALTNAKNIINNEDSSKEEINEALDSIENAIANLKEKPGDKANLTEKMTQAKNLNPNDYVDFTEVKNAIIEAEKVIKNNKSNQMTIDNAFELLENAIKNLKIKQKNGYTKKEIDDLISQGYIPVANTEDLNAIKSEYSRIWGKGSEWETNIAMSGGLRSGKKYIQVNDIDLSLIDNFIPIGNTNYQFKGIYDGGKFTISNLKINRPTTRYVGLFGSSSSATIQNVGLINANVIGEDYTGALIGRQEYGSILNSYSTGENITGRDHVGGLIGQNYMGSTSNSYSTINNVSGRGTIGGLAGSIYNSSNTKNLYSTGKAVGTNTRKIGGLVGDSNSTIDSSYFNIELNTSSPKGMGKTTQEMKYQSTYKGWNFDTIWKIEEEKNYPTLQ